MQQLKKEATASKIAELRPRSVTVFIASKFILLSGKWFWDLYADAVFCSDVILSMPVEFPGTQSIIHPDDRESVRATVLESSDKINHLEFRIITTYGEIKTLSGEAIEVAIDEVSIENFQEELMRKALDEKELEDLHLIKTVYESAEKMTRAGIWYYNLATNATWYSNYFFQIYDLPPQSLNPHFNTFAGFIHPEDKESVIDFIDKAYKQRSPLHMEYRIKTSIKEKLVRHTSQWFFNSRGECVLSGTLQDITEVKILEQEAEEKEQAALLYKQLLTLDEQHGAIGHWQVNLLTRKTQYSDSVYRIYGTKAALIMPGIHAFTNFIHPDDRNEVVVAYNKMIQEHTLPDIEFRVVRPDGKTRYISQRGKLLSNGVDLIMAGLIQDVTVQKTLEKRMHNLSENVAMQTFVKRHTEEMAGAGSWTLNLQTGAFAWSESFYSLLGFKPNTVELSYKRLLLFVHPDDQKTFRDEWELVIQEKKEAQFTFRFVTRGEVKYMKASFRILTNEDGAFFIGIVQNITKETVLEQQMFQRVQLAESLAENILDRVIITDINNTIILWNKPCEDVYGIKKDDAIGANFFDVFPQLKTEEELKLFNKVLKGESVSTYNNRSVLHKGYYNLHMMPLWAEKGIEPTGIIHIAHDVTKEVELKQSLNERLAFIESMVESSVDRIIVLDRNMNYQIWNKKCEEYYGWKKEEVIGKNVLEIFPGAQEGYMYAHFRKALKGETVYIPATESASEDYFETYLIPVKNEKEEVTGVLWTVHDLGNEYKLQKQKVREHEVLDALNENYMELDDDYRVRYANQNALDFFASDKELMIGRVIWEMIPQSVDTPIYHAIKKAMEEGISTQDEFVSPLKGTWMNVSVAPTADGVIVVFFDIQHIKETQQRLNESNALLQSVFNASLHGIILLKSLRNENGEIVDFEISLNNAISRKWNGRDLTGDKYAERFPGIKANGLFEAYKKVIETGEPMDMETCYEGEGFSNWYHVTAVKLGDALVATAEDITQRKRAEEELVKNLNIVQQAEQIAGMGSWEYNVATGDFHWSDGMYRLFGIEQGTKVQPQVYMDMALDEDKPIAQRIINNILKPASFEETLRIQNGDIKVLKIKANVLKDGPGQAQKILGIDLDITGIKNAEGKIRESQDLLQQTTIATPDCIAIYDLEKKQPTYLNNCLAQWTGYTNDELVNMGMEERLQFIHPDDRGKLLQFNESINAANDHEVKTIEYRLRKNDGSYICLRNRSKVFKRESGGRPTHILSVLQDVTEEVKLRNDLMERTEYAEAIIDASIDCISVYDKDMRFIAWNKRSEEMTNLKREAIIGKNLLDVFPKMAEHEELMEAYRRSLQGEYVHVPVKKGVYDNHYYERFFLPLKNEAGETYAMIKIMHDVSELVNRNLELKELNKTLGQKNKELEEKNEEITSFAFIASHDLKEPLRKLYTFSDWLLSRETANLSTTGKTYIKKIANSVRRMDMLIEDILVLAKIDSEKAPLNKVDLNAVLERVEGEMKDVIKEKGAEIEADHLPLIDGTDHQVFFLFKNLISNSLKFQSPGNVPQVKIGAEVIKADDKKQYVKVSFADNGLGFDQKYSKQIFHVFQRLHNQREYEGTGIGLAICKKIMENHGGSIRVESVPGKGSVFSCYFPVL